MPDDHYRRHLIQAMLAALVMTPVLTAALRAQAPSALARQVFVAESSFAASMAKRDTAAFAALVAPDAIFFGQKSVLRGKQQVVDGWRPLFAGPSAPFSWRPETVEVLATGSLAHSSGPVHDAKGNQIGVFNSIWRREPDGRWLVVFDKGCDVCPTARGP